MSRSTTVKAFYDLLWAERYHGLVAETQQQKELHAAMARTRYQNGVATEVDVLRSEVAVANGAPDLVRAQNAIRQARALLNYYLGRPLDFATRLIGDFQEKPWEAANLEELERDAVRRRPEIQRLRIAERSAATQCDLAKAESRAPTGFFRQLRHDVQARPESGQLRIYPLDGRCELHPSGVRRLPPQRPGVAGFRQRARGANWSVRNSSSRFASPSSRATTSSKRPQRR